MAEISREALLETALARAGQRMHASADHAAAIRMLHGTGRMQEAEVMLAALADTPPGAPADHEALGFAAFQLGKHDLARLWYARVVEAVPEDALAWYNIATTDRNLGRLDEAESACNRALNLAPNMASAALLRSQLRTQTIGRNHVDELLSLLARSGAPGSEVFLHYALGKEYDDLGEFNLAFAQFTRGAAARRRALSYDVRDDVRKLSRIADTFGRSEMAQAPPLATPAFGFIVGLPRSGTTMIERILTGNPRVGSNGETDNLFAALNEGAAAAAGGDVFERIANADPPRVQSAYRRRAAGSHTDVLVLEKLPFNYLYAGAIRLTLPNARTLLVTRTPADNCLAMFSTLFGSGYPFSYSLTELAEYFISYDHLMAHWRDIVGAQLLDIAYEQVVQDPVTHGRRVAAHFGVTWQDDMVRIENNRSASATASAAQVRNPIYRKAKGRWRNYARHLGPLMARLERAGIDPVRDT